MYDYHYIGEQNWRKKALNTCKLKYDKVETLEEEEEEDQVLISKQCHWLGGDKLERCICCS